MKKWKLTDNSLSKDKQKEQKQRASPKPILLNGNCASIKLHKYLNTTLNFPGDKPTNRESVESRKTNAIKSKRTHTPIYQSFKEVMSSSLKKLNKSKDKLASSIQLKQTKKKPTKTKSNISQKQQYLVRQFEEDKSKQKNRQKQKQKGKQNDKSKEEVLEQIEQVLLSFSLEEQIDDFQQYTKCVSNLNQRVNFLLQSIQESVEKSIIEKYKNLTINISTKYLNRLYDRAETADVSFNNTFQRIQTQTKQKYEKKIQKLMHVIAQKQRKEKQVNKLLYFLRKCGIDIDDYWNKSLIEERRCKTQMEKRFINDI